MDSFQHNDKSVCVIHNTSTEEASIDITTLTDIPFTTLNGIVGQGNATLENNVLTIAGLTSVVIR